MVHIGQSAWDRLVRLVLADADREVCGLLMGRRDGRAIVVEWIVPAANVAVDPRRRFEIDPAIVMRYLLDEDRSYSMTGRTHRYRVGHRDSDGSLGFEAPRGRCVLILTDTPSTAARVRRARPVLVGFYHSHPDGSAQPSRVDVDSAWPRMAYLIVGVNGDRVAESACWQVRSDDPSFRALSMQHRRKVATRPRRFVD